MSRARGYARPVITRDDLQRDLVTDSVTFVETHISWVLLHEREVFKIKKPVEMGFLDFSSVERRKHACEREVELNRRLAPDVYLGVIPVRKAAGKLSLGEEGEIVDWAVHMRRLDDRDRADVRLAEGRLTATDITRVATTLVDFHANARSDEETARFGQPEAIAVNVRENFTQTTASLGRYVSPAQASELAEGQLAHLERHAARFTARAEAGRVRDGHGDLRLEHVYLSDNGSITVLDCIEFNDRFRYADVASDLAFLAMDLSAHGHVELGEHLVAEYAKHSGDFDLYGVLDFYEGYRAFVRGKIAAFVADDSRVDMAHRSRAAASARRCFMLALATGRKALLDPSVVAVGGVIASGKSTVSGRLSLEMSAPVVDADRTRKQMLGVRATQPVHDGSWQGAYDPKFTEEVYAEVFRRAGVVLQSGRPVLVDASFRSRALRGRARALAAAHDVPFRLVECRVDHAVAKERLRERAKRASVSDGRLEIFDDFVAKWETIDEFPADEHVVLDTSQPLDSTIDRLRAAVQTWPSGLDQ